MNKDFEIYRSPTDQVPSEDKARLEGYLEGRAQAVELEKYKKEFERKIKEIKE